MSSKSRLRRLFRWSPSTVRAVCLSFAAAVVAVSVLSTKRAARVSYTTPGLSAVEARVRSGVAEFWWHDPKSNAYWADVTSSPSPKPSSLGFGTTKEWGDSMSLAWRPYHIAANPWPGPSSHHALAVPLWMILVPALLLAGYSHGLVVGLHRGAKGRCSRCGYSRSGLGVEAACPECGSVPPAVA